LDHKRFRAGGEAATGGVALAEESPNPASRKALRFGPFELEPDTGELRKDGVPVLLRYQPSRVLALLVSRRGRLVTREEIQALVWGGATHVDYEQGLNYCIRDIRSALGDSAENPCFVETLPRRGYRFIATVEGAPGPPDSAARPTTRRPLALASILCLLAALGGLAAWLLPGSGASETPRDRVTIAVLPFEDMSGDPARAYFAEGLTEELIAQLGRLHPGRLGVIGRTTARGFGQQPRPIAALARELRVQYALEGSVRQSAERVRVTARLVRVADRKQVWSETFEAPAMDILDLQARLARAAASGVHFTLDPGEPAPTKPLRIDPEAYRLYVRGRTLWNSWSVSGLRRSVESLSEAIRIAPDYPVAHAALADAYIALADQSPEAPGPFLRRAKQAALRALELDSSLAEAHAALGMVLGAGEFDWTGAATELRRAIALNPSYPTARHWYSHVLRVTGELDEALAQIRTAQELAPHSAIIGHNVAMVRLQRGELSAAVSVFRGVIASSPSFPPAHMGLGRALLLQGDFSGSLQSLERAVELSDRNARYEAALAYVYAAAGKLPAARHIVERLEREPAGRAYDVAIARAGLADYDDAVRSLERAIQARDPAVRNVLLDERLRPLRRDVRWGSLTRAVGLPPHGPSPNRPARLP
jgi:TolB-like protein/DNA-binding winged helix-turn-helix (wHTH) protein/tetratricopeptide (TPR) repeat protein